MQLHF
jgi:hypothetical protein